MQDITKLSDEELDRMYTQHQQPSIQGLSDEELDSISTQQGAPDLTPIIDEQHPSISWKDRTVVKNFGGDIMQSMQYLQDKYPNLQIDQKGGEIVAKGKNEKEWRKLDPSSLEFSDVTDIGYDIAAGLGEGAATVGGAILGAGAGPAGMMGGGIAAAGAAGTGLEGLRQGIGQALGVNEMDVGEMAKSGAMSAAFAPLMGIGGGAKLAAKAELKAIEKGVAQGLSTDAIEAAVKGSVEAAEKYAKGIIPNLAGKAKDGISTNLAHLTSGIDASRWKSWFKHRDELLKWTDDDKLGQVATLKKTLSKGLHSDRQTLMKAYDSIKEIDDVVDMQDITDTTESYFKETLDSALTNADEEAISSVAKEFKEVFTKTGMEGEMMQKEISVDQLLKLQKYLKNLTKKSAFGVSDPAAQQVVLHQNSLGRQLQSLVEDKLETVTQKHIIRPMVEGADMALINTDEVFGSVPYSYYQLKDLYGSNADMLKDISKLDEGKLFAVMNAAKNTKSGARLQQIKKLERIAKDQGVDLTDLSDKIQAYVSLKDAPWFPVSGTATSTSRTAAGAATGGLVSEAGGGGGRLGMALGMTGGIVGLGPKGMKGMGTVGHKIGRGMSALDRAITAPFKPEITGKGLYRGVWKTMQDKSSEKVKQYGDIRKPLGY